MNVRATCVHERARHLCALLQGVVLRTIRLGSPLGAYTAALAAAPLATKTATAAAVGLAGDAMAQGRSDEQCDVARGVGFALFGACSTGAFQGVVVGVFPWLSDHFHGELFGSR